jgi:hypothetical protein
MKKIITITALVVLGLSFTLFSAADSEKNEIEKVVKDCYFNGAFNGLDYRAMEKGFHGDFAIFSANGNELSRYEIADWVAGVKKRSNDPGYDKSEAQMDCRIASIDITGGAAAVKVEMSKNGKMIYTDYLSLLKFDEGWKIAAKVYHHHK